jgi:type I restriction enzyme S subunit
VLSSLDDKIELLREQNKTLEATAQAIFKEWFVRFNFPNENGEPYATAGGKMIDSILGLIPEGWRVGRLGDIVELFDAKRIPLASDVRAKRKGKYPYYGATSIMDFIDDYLFDGTFLLLAEDGSVIDDRGRPVLQYVWGQFWVSNHAHVLQGKNGFSTEMLHVVLKDANITGIVNGAVQLKINQANLLSFEILIPDKHTLNNFDLLLKPIYQKIKNISSQIQTLSTLRDTLLPKLMKGEIRVKSEE